ncbi:MAG: porin family protein [Acidobacteriota bacterium]
MRQHQWFLIILAILVLVVSSSTPALAQIERGSEGDVFVGGILGDDLTDDPVSGMGPELDDDVEFGIRYAYNFTSMWGIEGTVSFSPNSATDTPGGDVDLDLFLIDVDAIWHFTPDKRIVGYLVGGVGFANADLDHPITGTVNGKLTQIDDDSGITLNAGVGAKFFATDNFLIRAEVRYRYIDALVDENDDSLNTVDGTVGVGWAF